MKKILLFAAALVLFSCSKEDNAPKGKLLNNNVEKTVFYATIEDETAPGTGTKVYADENLSLLWNEDDRISIFNRNTINDQYVFTGEDGDNSGSFEEVPANTTVEGNDLEHIYAVYPYSAGNSINNTGSITVTLPSEQTYLKKSFGKGANTMVAITDNTFLGFRNACGYLRFRFYGDNVKVKSITLEGNNGEKIAGKAYITPYLSSLPTVAIDETGTRTITLNCPDLVNLTTSEVTDFIFVVPPITFSKGFRVCIIDNQNRFFEKSSTKSLTIFRNKMENMGAMNVLPTYVQFEDANFKAYCVENFDKDGDGEINYVEAQEITKVDVYTNNPDITSVKGIEYFKNLTILRCKGRGDSSDKIGKLTSLDVSNNRSLKMLECEDNQLIGELDVSGFTALRRIYCDNNQLTGLIASGCTSLQILRCDNNQLTSLIFSGCPSLNELTCSNNQLTEGLDFSGYTSLKTLQCYSARLPNLNVSGCTALTDLRCSTNQLSSLNVGGCAVLKYLYCDHNQLTNLNVSGCSALTDLSCDYNLLTSLDVSGCTALYTFGCNNNKLTSLDVRFNTNLVTLNAWPQSGTLATLVKKTGQSINYYANGSSSAINPSDYGTEIIEVD